MFVSKDESEVLIAWERFSQFNRLRRTVAWIVTLFKSDTTVNELIEESEQTIGKLVQRESYPKELNDLKAGKQLSSNSKISPLFQKES